MKTRVTEKAVAMRFAEFEKYLVDPSEWKVFIKDLRNRINAFIDERKKDTFIIRGQNEERRLVEAVSQALRNLERQNPALVEGLWLVPPDLSSQQLHDLLLESCDEWLEDTNTNKSALIALTEVFTDSMAEVSQKHLTIKISAKDESPFMRFFVVGATLVFNLARKNYATEDTDYSPDTCVNWVRRYLEKNRAPKKLNKPQ
jgi:hypothetical protein